MKRYGMYDMISFAVRDVLVIIDLVLRGLRGIIIMNAC